MWRADGSGPHLVSTTSRGAIWFKQMTFWRVERGSTRRQPRCPAACLLATTLLGDVYPILPAAFVRRAPG
jgi:hypothetical protein